MLPSRRTLTAVLIVLSFVLQSSAARAQKDAPAERPACDAERALQLAREQLAEAKAFASGAKRVNVMARAADLLWPFDEAQARALFNEAFEVASAHYREHGQETVVRKSSRADATVHGLTYMLPDPRVVVVRTLARRDPTLAQKLSVRAAEETRQRVNEVESEEKARALVGLTHVYWRLDPSRVEQALAEAVAAINRVPEIDPTRPFVTRAIDGRKFNFFASYPSPNYNLETVLREVGERDFDAALAAASGLDDKHLRALAIISLASKCLEDAPKPEKQSRPKKSARGGRKQ